MMRRKHTVPLSRGYYAQSEGDDVNPNEFTSNIADCMLVLVLGLLVALVARFGLDLTALAEETREDRDLIGLEVDLDVNNDGEIDTSYEKAGTVYYDNETGNYYLLTDE